MATVHAHLDEPNTEAGENTLVFKKGVSAVSWGSEVTARLESTSDSETRIVFTTAETWAITDWERGRRRVADLMEAMGAEPGDSGP